MKRAAATPAGPRLARRVRALEPVVTQAMSLRASTLKAQGRHVLDFSVGEPDQGTPAHVVAAAKQALDAGRTRYAPSAGLPELRAAVAEAYRRDFGAGFERDEVVATIGGKQALYLACQALLGPGDEVVLPTPYWPTFAEAVRLAGGKPVFVDLQEEHGFGLTARALTKAVTSRTRAVIVNTPSNPTGAVVAPEELLAIGRLAKRRQLALLYDDTYAWLALEPQPAGLLGDLRRAAGDQLVVLGTSSKTHCMTGWRIGWLLGAKPLCQAVVSLVSHSTQCPATFAQVAAVTALTGPQEHVRALVQEYRRRRDLVHPAVRDLAGVSCVRPAGAFYVFPNVSRLLSPRLRSSLELAERLLEEAGLACVPGEGFGRPGFLRLSFARPAEELREGLRRLQDFFAAL